MEVTVSTPEDTPATDLATSEVASLAAEAAVAANEAAHATAEAQEAQETAQTAQAQSEAAVTIAYATAAELEELRTELRSGIAGMMERLETLIAMEEAEETEGATEVDIPEPASQNASEPPAEPARVAHPVMRMFLGL